MPRVHEQTHDREYRKFKSELLKPAVAQINEHTEIEIELVEHREDGAVVDLQFTISLKLDQGDIEPVNLTPVEQALALDIGELGHDTLVDRYGEAPVLRALDVVARQLRQEPGTNALAHLMWVLEDVAGEGARKAAKRRTSAPAQVAAAPAPVPSVPVPDPAQELEREQLRRDFEALPTEQQKQWLQRLRDDVVDKGVTTPRAAASHRGRRLEAARGAGPAGDVFRVTPLTGTGSRKGSVSRRPGSTRGVPPRHAPGLRTVASGQCSFISLDTGK